MGGSFRGRPGWAVAWLAMGLAAVLGVLTPAEALTPYPIFYEEEREEDGGGSGSPLPLVGGGSGKRGTTFAGSASRTNNAEVMADTPTATSTATPTPTPTPFGLPSAWGLNTSGQLGDGTTT